MWQSATAPHLLCSFTRLRLVQLYAASKVKAGYEYYLPNDNVRAAVTAELCARSLHGMAFAEHTT